MKLTPEQLHVLQHSLGVDEYGRGNRYRNRYLTDTDSSDGKIIKSLIALDFMASHGPQTLAGGMHYYYVTPLGERAMTEQSPKPPQLTRSQRRYRAYLELEFNHSFIDFLTDPSLADYRRRHGC